MHVPQNAQIGLGGPAAVGAQLLQLPHQRRLHVRGQRKTRTVFVQIKRLRAKPRRFGETVGVQTEQHLRAALVDQLGAADEIFPLAVGHVLPVDQVVVAGAGHDRGHARLRQNLLQFQGDGQRDVFFQHARSAHGAGIRAAVAGIDGHHAAGPRVGHRRTQPRQPPRERTEGRQQDAGEDDKSDVTAIDCDEEDFAPQRT